MHWGWPVPMPHTWTHQCLSLSLSLLWNGKLTVATEVLPGLDRYGRSCMVAFPHHPDRALWLLGEARVPLNLVLHTMDPNSNPNPIPCRLMPFSPTGGGEGVS
ncbi:hypothetical protein BX600DRAFT_88530 [Xylariales sp. PMI_506]|nr:hypothetical protein BX600DRAFT_88530 [Xylariales sp. PMI_506]